MCRVPPRQQSQGHGGRQAARLGSACRAALCAHSTAAAGSRKPHGDARAAIGAWGPTACHSNFSTNSLASIWGSRADTGSQCLSPNNSSSKPLVSSAEGNGVRTQPGAASQLTGAGIAMSRGARCWPTSTGRLAGTASTQVTPCATLGACRAHPSPAFPLENREMFKTLVKKDALPKV